MRVTLDDSQQRAVENIAQLGRRVYLLIGGAGSGKTTTIQHLLEMLWAAPDNDITDETTYLAAPTGKAARVLSDSFKADNFETCHEPKTIHRLLGFNPGLGWQYGVSNKLDAMLVVLDEASMVDSLLLSRVIDALLEECHLILVGDENQLPPVQPGQPFTDLIMHGPQEIVNRLTANHRQQQGSLIAGGCLSVMAGKMPTFGRKGEHTLQGPLEDDLFLIEQEDKEDIPAIVADLCRPWHAQQADYAVLAPQKTGVCGVDAINKYLQEALNPEAPGKPQLKLGWLTLRLGDRVLQTKNNYDLGAFNGFTGIIVKCVGDNIVVDFDGELVEYEKTEHIKQLALGYCMTVHKSQGSSFKKGILIFHSSHYFMATRSIFYTGISRFRQELHIIGDKRMVKRGLSNVVSGERNTLIKERLKGALTVRETNEHPPC